MSLSRYEPIKRTYGDDHLDKLHRSKILVVGAGGIGCEVLKDLVLSGFVDIEIVDLDTIDVSNLNRQFLFRSHHVGQSKATTAAEAAMGFNPEAKIIAHHGNVKESKFGIHFVKKFSLVLNALDNVDARRHMNRLCLAAGVPLLDSGTTGYLGQVMPIKKGETACYECKPKPTQKVYPICTIRSTPDKPVHCIVWAKECYRLIFGVATESMLFDDEATGSAADYMGLLDFPSTTNLSKENLTEHCAKLLNALFADDVKTKIEMDIYKSSKIIPVPLSTTNNETGKEIALKVLSSSIKRPFSGANWDRRILSDSECVAEMILAIVEAIEGGLRGSSSFDKDDDLSMRFVSAAACVRSRTFHIDTMGLHDTKGIAGNIIPAIATTNAIVAGLQVMAAVKILRHNLEEGQDYDMKKCCPHTYCLRHPTRKGFFLQPTPPECPVSTCFVCAASIMEVFIDTTNRTLEDFVKSVLKSKLGFNAPSMTIGDSPIYEEGEDACEELAENLSLKLVDVPGGGMGDGAQIEVDDFTQDLSIRIMIHHKATEDFDEETTPEAFEVRGKIDSAQNASDAPQNNNNNNDDDDFEIVEAASPIPHTLTKRTRSDDIEIIGKSVVGENAETNKKIRVE